MKHGLPSFPIALAWLAALAFFSACNSRGHDAAQVAAVSAPPPPPPAPARLKLIFAETNEFWTAPTLIASLTGAYTAAGLDVEVVKFPSGLAAKNAVLSGSADIGLSALTPIAIAGFNKEPLALLATYMESDAVVKFVAKSSGPLRPEAMRNLTIGYIPGTISEIFLDRMTEKYGIDRRKLKTATFKPTELIPALKKGDIGGFVAWEPFPLLAASKGVGEFADPTLYRVGLQLVVRRAALAEKGEAYRRFLSAIQASVEHLAEAPDASRASVEKALAFEPDQLKGIWPALHFELKLDKADLVARLRVEGKWAAKAAYAKGDLPSYDDYVDTSVFETYSKVAGPRGATQRSGQSP